MCVGVFANGISVLNKFRVTNVVRMGTIQFDGLTTDHFARAERIKKYSLLPRSIFRPRRVVPLKIKSNISCNVFSSFFSFFLYLLFTFFFFFCSTCSRVLPRSSNVAALMDFCQGLPVLNECR